MGWSCLSTGACRPSEIAPDREKRSAVCSPFARYRPVSRTRIEPCLRRAVVLCTTAVILSAAQPAELQTRAPSETTIEVGGVQVRGESIKSSTGVPREPHYVLRNLTDAPATVELVSLYINRHDLARVDNPPGKNC